MNTRLMRIYSDLTFKPDWFTLVLQGPDDLHHSWLKALAPGQGFESVPVSLAFSDDGLDAAVGELTHHRRASHIPVAADSGRPLIFNDYMNTLMGDPTADRLLPLIDAAAEAGAQYFCIDAGWYDDGGHWWDSVGEWRPSTTRFGDGGLAGVLEHIRGRGLTPGLWIEPEVVGVRYFLAAGAVCTVIEYTIAEILEYKYGMQLWDYIHSLPVSPRCNI